MNDKMNSMKLMGVLEISGKNIPNKTMDLDVSDELREMEDLVGFKV
jgi:hypothetical protein